MRGDDFTNAKSYGIGDINLLIPNLAPIQVIDRQNN
jgi:hypothetical protein